MALTGLRGAILGKSSHHGAHVHSRGAMIWCGKVGSSELCRWCRRTKVVRARPLRDGGQLGLKGTVVVVVVRRDEG
jgi:hypothetical protein